jgi:hypothetical protein
MQTPPGEIRLVHGDPEASEVLAGILREIVPDTHVAQRDTG